MKIVVIGGTGLIGSKLIKKLRASGHDAVAASPDTGVDVITGRGLAEALKNAEVVVDVSNAPDWGDAAVMDFFQTSARTSSPPKPPPGWVTTSRCRSSAPTGCKAAVTSAPSSPRRKH